MRCCAPMLLAPIVIQAEQGALGNEFASADDGRGTQYVTITGTIGGRAPATEARVSSFEVEFPAPGSSEPSPDPPNAEPADAGPPPQDVDAGP